MVLDLASLDEQDSWQIQDIDSTDVRKWLIPKNQVAACVVGPDGPVAAATKIPLTPRPDVAVLISLPGRLFCFSPFERSYWTIPDKWRLKNSRAESAR
jgi:hypothetical protein